ncbi:MAG: ribose-phosphate diphosphokinase [Candidatus Aenigmatarchaeota archaeon]
MPEFAFILPELSVFGIKEKTLGERVWEELHKKTEDFDLVKAMPMDFTDSTFKVRLNRSVRDKRVYIFAAPYLKPADQFFLNVQMIDASFRADCDRINLVETYNPWYTQDKRDVGYREAVTGEIVADAYKKAGLRRLFYFEPHSLEALDGWYRSVDPIYMAAFHARHLVDEFKDEFASGKIVVGQPDTGSKRSQHLAKALGVRLVKIGKAHDYDKAEELTALPVLEDLSGLTIVTYDDMIRTGKTALETSTSAKNAGAEKVIYVATHPGIYNPEELFGSKYIDAVRCTATIPNHPIHEKLKEYDIAPFAAEIIYRKSHGMDVSGFIISQAPSYKEK